MTTDTGLTTRDGHPITLHVWDRAIKGVYVQPLPSDMAVGDGPRCGWKESGKEDVGLEYMDRGCDLKPDHTCGHAFGVYMSYRSLYSEDDT